jgi:hypothetical protein
MNPQSEIEEPEEYDMSVWSHIFNEVKYTGNCDTTITSKQIKDCKKTWKGKTCQFEPRLLCKQDSSETRPQIFKTYGVNIISITNSSYLITKKNIYQKITYDDSKLPIEIDRNLESLLLRLGDSESSLIDNLRYSGVFEDYFLKEPILFGSLLNGRHRCTFDTIIDDTIVPIKGVQYETDGCYESKNKILIIEAKSDKKKRDTFNIRQIYFTYRAIYDKILDSKEIISLFIHKVKDCIYIWQFKFINPLVLSSIYCIGHYKFVFSN